MPFSTRVVVTQELEPGEHRSLRILSNHAKKDDVEEFLRKAERMNTPRDRQNVEAVLQVSVRANDELYHEIRRDANMCDALRELMNTLLSVKSILPFASSVTFSRRAFLLIAL